MGYTSRRQWEEEKIIDEIKNVMNCLIINRMPTSSEIKSVTKNSKLTNAIRRYGGYKYYADIIGIKQSDCETRIGCKGETIIQNILESKGYKVEKTSTRCPYDLLVNDYIKIDVKTSNAYLDQYYSFNLEKKAATCDIYILFCLGNERKFIIPSKFLMQTQVTISKDNSKWDQFINKWNYIEQYDNFYKSLKKESD